MAVKKKKASPYDPYQPYGNHSYPWYQQQAGVRAQNDVNAQIAALPSSQFYTDSAQQLANALRGINQNQAGVASAGGDLYQHAFQNAVAPANKASMVAGGGQIAGPANTSLVGALGATMAQALSGGEAAAVARGRNDVLARAGQETAIRAKLPSATAQYLKDMTDQAMQARAALDNHLLAQSQFGLQASNTAFDNQLAADSLNASIAGKQSTAAAKSQASLNKLMAAARKAATDARKGVKGSKTIAGDYTYSIPNSVLQDDTTVTGNTQHVVRAKNGQDANAQLLAWMTPIIKAANPDAALPNPASYITGPFKPVTQETLTPGSRTAQLHAAIAVFEDAGYSHAQAVQYARKIIGSKVGTKKKQSGQSATDTIESHR